MPWGWIALFSGVAMLLGGLVSILLSGATGALVLFPVGIIVVILGAQGVSARAYSRPSSREPGWLAKRIALWSFVVGLVLIGISAAFPEDNYETSTANFVLGLCGGLSCWVSLTSFMLRIANKRTLGGQPWEFRRMLDDFAKLPMVSGREYGNFILKLEAAQASGNISRMRKNRMVRELHSLMVEKGRRVTGFDTVELESTLKGSALPESARKRVLAHYERLRMRIQGTRLGTASE